MGDYRVIAEIMDDKFVVLIVKVGHGSKVYGGH
ncbi:MAG: type II toxin-antitoxin system RelE/ParE family toxin [Desulfovibrio sp.]|nr:type II toxin-antitoxin system RelE/ParE family toxin [Desulfovibrio sp.]